jgi:6-phosphogluconolactonase (cycloisomerase 2 family)
VIDQYLYVNSELQSELLIYSTSTYKLLSRTDITPPHFSPSQKRALLSAEIHIHPIHQRTLYISNRGARRLTRSNPELGFGPEEGNGEGDTITIILLSPTSEVERLVYLQTGLDWIRGMRVSGDGRFLACCGEVRGGLEVYEIGGERGEILELVAKHENVRDVNCVLWV